MNIRIALLGIVTSFLLIPLTANAQSILVAATDAVDKEQVKNVEVARYLNKFNSEITIDKMVLREFEGNFYLLARDSQNNKVYLVETVKKDDGIWLKRSKELNACEGSELSLEIFNFEDGVLHGCSGTNHSIMWKQ